MRILLPLVIAATIWYGSMTYYSLPGQTMRNGQQFRDDALTCAVDASPEWWDAEADAPIHRELEICPEGSQRCVTAEITDTGWLTEYDVLIDCTPGIWQALGLPLGLGRVPVVVMKGEND